MSSPGWVACLDAFGLHLEQQRRAVLEGRADDVAEFAPSPGLGPLPGALIARARTLQAESESLCALLAEQMQHTTDALSQLQRSDEPARASFIDSRC